MIKNYLFEENKNLQNSKNELKDKINIFLIIICVISGIFILLILSFVILKLIKYYKNKQIKFTNIQNEQELSSVNTI